MKRLAWLFGLFVVQALVMGFQAGESIPSLDTWLQAASGPLAAGIVGGLLALVAEYWPKFQSLPKKGKRLVFFGLCLIVPTSMATLRGLLGYVPWSLDPLYWHAVWYGFAAFGVGTLAHTPKLPAAPDVPMTVD